MKKLAFLAIMALVMILPVSVALANPDYQIHVEGECTHPDITNRHWFGGLSLESGLGSKFKNGTSTVHPEGFFSWNVNYISPVAPLFGFHGEFGLPLAFDKMPRVGAGPIFVLDEEVRLEVPVFYQFDHLKHNHLVGLAMGLDVVVHRFDDYAPLSVFIKLSGGSISPANEGYVSSVVGVGFIAPARF
ncbi:MAG: hypothetical protein AAB568_00245 [Patescibacteria group bacterium]